MVLACISVADPSVLELAGKLREAGFGATAARIDSGHERRVLMLALDTAERDEIVEALVDCPHGLAELRGVLVQEAARARGFDVATSRTRKNVRACAPWCRMTGLSPPRG
jgi:hypothetical protein